MPKSLLALIPLIALLLAACGPSNGDASADGQADEIVITPEGNEMLFEQTEFTVEAGQTVNLVFENTATSPAMVHNVVILTSDDDDDVNRVGQSAVEAGADAEYIPEDDAILAYTELAEPGETVSVTFTAPSTPGRYRFICTYPGHYMMMQGTMIVT